MSARPKEEPAMPVTFHIQIQAPPEKVFDALADVANHPAWSNPKAEMKMTQTSGDGPGPQATYHSEGVFVKKPVSADITVTDFKRPTSFAIRSDQHQQGKADVWYENRYSLKAVNGGTELTKQVSTGTKAFLLYVAYPAVKADAMTALKNLKATIESGA
jgi:uncharacterized protein YndB with AHSA1/START domain